MEPTRSSWSAESFARHGGLGGSGYFAIPINYARGMLNNLQTPMTLDEMRTRLGAVPQLFKPTGSFPTQWKSLTNATRMTLRIEEERASVERILPFDARNAGAFWICDFKRDADKYVGTVRTKFPCWNSWKGEYKSCTFEVPGEILSLSPKRIEGRMMAPPDDAKFNCRVCTYSKPNTWRPFVWIPE